MLLTLCCYIIIGEAMGNPMGIVDAVIGMAGAIICWGTGGTYACCAGCGLGAGAAGAGVHVMLACWRPFLHPGWRLYWLVLTICTPLELRPMVFCLVASDRYRPEEWNTCRLHWCSHR